MTVLRRVCGLVAFALVLAAFHPYTTRADSVDEIRAQIKSINEERAKLDAEIKGYEAQLTTIAGSKQTLQSAIQTLDVSRSKTATQIKDIQKKIQAANLRLEVLADEITKKEASIRVDQAALASSLRAIEAEDNTSMVERLVGSSDFGDAWASVDRLAALNETLRSHSLALSEAKVALNEQHEAVSGTKQELSSSNTELESQKKALDINRQGKQELLTKTQAEEAQYQALLTQKRAQQKAFESQLFAFESQLSALLDPSAIPTKKSGVLAYPLKDVYITQYFGATVDAKRLYVSGSHGGIDFRAAVGTPVYAALDGTVTDTEPTKARSGCQYGKFVLIKHPNGLSTIYGHMSQVSVSPGQSVKIGQLIGYSGDTGYATGPHLHFGVYATAGIRVTDASALGSTYCAGIKTVAASPDAYLDPMSYL